MSLNRNIILAGFMGVGKSTVGSLLASRLGMQFVDTDTCIEEEAGKSIAEIFAQDGEAAFRSIEAQVCQRLADRSGLIIATGGGALLNSATRAALERCGPVICLVADLDEIIRRVGEAPERPLFRPDRARLAALLATRLPLYASLPYQVDTTRRTPEEIAEEIASQWKTLLQTQS